MLKNATRCGGKYQFHLNGELVGESDNVLTDGFFTRLAARNVNCQNAFLMCGSGTSEPLASDVGLTSPITDAVSPVRSPYSTSRFMDVTNGPTVANVYTYTFPQGTFTGTVSEVAARFHTSTSGITESSAVDSKVLVKSDGILAPVEVGPTDSFTITFTYFTIWNPQAVGTIDIVGTTHTITWEMINLDDWEVFGRYGYTGGDFGATMSNGNGSIGVSSTLELVNDPTYSTVIGGYLYMPQPTTPIESGSIPVHQQFNLTSAQLTAGVKYIQCRRVADPLYGIHFDPPITDQAATLVTIVFRYTFQRFTS